MAEVYKIGDRAVEQDASPQRQKRRRQLVEAAGRVFARLGYHGMTMQHLADEAGVSVGLAYRYFPSKEQVLSTVILDILEDYQRDLPLVMAARRNPVAKLASGFEAYCRVVDRHIGGALIAYRDSGELNRETIERIKELEMQTTDLLAEAIRAGQEEGILEPCDTFLVAYDLIIIAHMWSLKHWALSKRMTVHEFIQRQLDLFLRSLVKPEFRDQYLDLFAAPRLD